MTSMVNGLNTAYKVVVVKNLCKVCVSLTTSDRIVKVITAFRVKSLYSDGDEKNT